MPSSLPRPFTQLSLVAAILLVLLSLLAAAVERVNEAADRVSCNLGQLNYALYAYQDQHGGLPPAIVRDKEGRPLYSWRVLLLPYLEAQDVYKEFRLDEPWDSPHNVRLLSRMPRTYAAPGRRAKRVPPDHTFLRVFVGPGTVFEEIERGPSGDAPRVGRKIPDDFPGHGEQLLLVVEAGEAVPWTRPEVLRYDPTGPLPPLRGPFREGFRALSLTGRYQFLPYDTPEAELRARFARPGGGEPASGR